MNTDHDLSRTCKIDLQELTESIRDLDSESSRPHNPASPHSSTVQTLVDLLGEEVRALRFKNAKVTEIVTSLLEKLNLPDTHTHLLQAAKRLSSMVEASESEPSYHNQYHVAEVVMASFILGKRERFSPVQIAEVVLAAAAHDLGHPGKTNSTPFEIESLSRDLALPVLKECHYTEAELHRFKEMVMATDFVNGVPKARVAYLTARGLPPGHPERILAAQCLILTEADILFSCFNTEYNEELSKLLSQEWNLPSDNLTLKQRLGFLNSVVFISDASKQLGLDTRRQQLIAALEAKLLQSS